MTQIVIYMYYTLEIYLSNLIKTIILIFYKMIYITEKVNNHAQILILDYKLSFIKDFLMSKYDLFKSLF